VQAGRGRASDRSGLKKVQWKSDRVVVGKEVGSGVNREVVVAAEVADWEATKNHLPPTTFPTILATSCWVALPTIRWNFACYKTPTAQEEFAI
jgi:hypothetical protein